MSRRLAVAVAAVLVAASIGIAVLWTFASAGRPLPDTPALNDAVRVAEASWPDLDPTDFSEGVTIAGLDGKVLLTTTDDPPTTALDAASRRTLTAPVMVDGAAVALAYVSDGTAEADVRARNAVATTASVVLLLAAAGAIGLLWWMDARLLRPFQRLETFATDVAAGHLDAPLDMDRGNVFGAWTESFDLMRTELAEARRREEEANLSKRELVAQISHDVRTPVASIAATAEVLRARATEAESADRLDVILAKADQISRLMTDLARAGVTATALEIKPVEFSSGRLVELVRDADHTGITTVAPIDACLLVADPHRLAQVIDNVVGNAAKYAGGELEVTSRIDGPMLALTFADRGPGMPDGEIETAFARGVRGSNVGDTPGEGLGLFTSAQLMERMGGAITVENRDGGGFVATLLIPLAGQM